MHIYAEGFKSRYIFPNFIAHIQQVLCFIYIYAFYTDLTILFSQRLLLNE